MESSFGDFLRSLRGKMSLRDAAKLTNLSYTYIGDLEKGINRSTGAPLNPTVETLKKLAEAYNYPYLDLMQRYKGGTDVSDALAKNASSKPKISLEEYRQMVLDGVPIRPGQPLSEKKKQQLLTMLDLFIEEDRVKNNND